MNFAGLPPAQDHERHWHKAACLPASWASSGRCPNFRQVLVAGCTALPALERRWHRRSDWHAGSRHLSTASTASGSGRQLPVPSEWHLGCYYLLPESWLPAEQISGFANASSDARYPRQFSFIGYPPCRRFSSNQSIRSEKRCAVLDATSDASIRPFLEQRRERCTRHSQERTRVSVVPKRP